MLRSDCVNLSEGYVFIILTGKTFLPLWAFDGLYYDCGYFGDMRKCVHCCYFSNISDFSPFKKKKKSSI